MTDIVVLGSINMDLVVRTKVMPRPGETARGKDFVTIPGGKGANQAAAAARLGARVEMVGRVGADSFGPVLLENLRQQGVGTGHVQMDSSAASGIAMIIVDSRGENSIVVDPGANGCVSMDDVHGTQDLLASADYLLLQLEVPLACGQGRDRCGSISRSARHIERCAGVFRGSRLCARRLLPGGERVGSPCSHRAPGGAACKMLARRRIR